LALHMRRLGLDVAKVVAFDTFAPGYPRRLPWPVRMGIHAMNFMSRPGGRKWEYLAERFRNVRHRLLTAAGLGYWGLPDPPNVGGLSEQVLKRVWASLERARMRYWPTGKFDGPVVLVSSEKPEQWAATRLDDPLKGWARWTTQPVQVLGVPAGHMEIFGDDNLGLLVEQMRDVLRAAKGKARRASHRRLGMSPW